MQRTVVTATALLALIPSTAQANGTVTDVTAAPPVQYSLALAVHHFGGMQPSHCPAGVRVYTTPDLPSKQEVEGAIGWAALYGCDIYLHPRMMHDYPWFLCGALVHEYGHVLGFAHSPDPASPMYGGSLVLAGVCDPARNAVQAGAPTERRSTTSHRATKRQSLGRRHKRGRRRVSSANPSQSQGGSRD